MLLTDEKILLAKHETIPDIVSAVDMLNDRRIAKAQLKKVVEILGKQSMMFPSGINHPGRKQSYVGIPLNVWQSLLKEIEQ